MKKLKKSTKKEVFCTDKCDVLIVEDEPSFRDLIGKIIRDRFPNLNVQFAVDGLEGLEKVKLLKPRILWTCVKLPRMDGLELIEWIRRNPDFKNTRIILCTAYYTKNVKKRALELGINTFLPKPFKIEEALSAIAANMGDMKIGREKRGAAARKCLGDKRLEAFLRACRGATHIVACGLINEELDRRETLDSIFCTQDDYGYQLAVLEGIKDEFEISFGCLDGPEMGDGGRWVVRFDSDDRVKQMEEKDYWIS